MELLPYLVPSEEHHSHEGSFHEEGKDTFDGKRSTEDIPYEPGIIAPVGAEFKFKYDSCRYADSKIDSENLLPESCSPFPEFIFLYHVYSLHDSHYHCKTQRKRHKEPVVTGRKGELRP